MALNEILPFADTATNILTQAAYSVDPQRNIGHQPGIARSMLENKALKQSSIIAASLAQFTADNQLNDITDADSVTDIASWIADAISAYSIANFPSASMTVEGKIELATSAEAQAMTDALRAITPSTLGLAFKGANQLLLSTGYQYLPGGVIIQWGTASTGNNAFPITYPNQLFSISLGSVQGGTANCVGFSVSNVTGFALTNFAGTTPVSGSANYIAIGY